MCAYESVLIYLCRMKQNCNARFACYRERDLDEVLQTTAIFSNVSKGVLAKKEDLMLVFGTDDAAKISIKILAEGELQVSDKERKLELDTLFRDVAGILSDKCINPKSKKPYTIGVLERALKDIHFSVDPKRPAKTQAFEVRCSRLTEQSDQPLA